MRSSKAVLFIVLLAGASAFAQIPATQRAGFNLPIGQVPAPNTPGGAAIVFGGFFEGDGAQGLRQFLPADPANPDPLNSGFLVFDAFNSLGGGGLCFPMCKAGQVVDGGAGPFNTATVFLASYDHSGGGGGLTNGGVYRVLISPAQGGAGTPPGPTSFNIVAPAFGLAGDQPSALALGPDGNLYVGFLKNGNVKRIVNPYLDPSDKTQIVQSVGGAPNGRPIRALAFAGADLYVAYTQGLAVIHNAISTSCQGGCNAVPVADGFAGAAHVGLTSDGVNRLYVAINANGVWRYTISTGAMTLVSTGGPDPNTNVPLTFAFVAGHTNLLQLDHSGNLWIGDDTSDGLFNFSGRIWYISAASLSQIP